MSSKIQSVADPIGKLKTAMAAPKNAAHSTAEMSTFPTEDVDALIKDAEGAEVILEDAISHIKPIWDWIAAGGPFGTAAAPGAPQAGLKSLLLQLIQIILGKLIPTTPAA